MFREFFRWWFGQLRELVPERWRGAEGEAGDALVIAPAGPASETAEAVRASFRRNGKETSLGRFGLSAGAVSSLPRPSGKPAVLRLGEADVLGKTVALPLAAERQLGQVLAFEMDRESPFKPEEVFWTHLILRRDRQRRQLIVRLLLLPRARVERLLAALEPAGIVPHWAEIGAGPDRGSRIPLGGVEGGHLGRDGSRRLLWPAAAACLLLALGAVVTPFARQAAQFSGIEAKIAGDRAAAAEADKLRQELERLSGSIGLVDSERAKTGRPLATLAALTSLLPDDSYLTEFTQQQRKVTLSGRSAAASRLIGALAGGAGLRNPVFAAPVTRIEATRSEIFSITAEAAP